MTINGVARFRKLKHTRGEDDASLGSGKDDNHSTRMSSRGRRGWRK